MKYLLIGGAGFIGTNFAERLIQNGKDVIIADNLSRKGSDINLDYLKDKHGGDFEFVRTDIRSDFEKLVELANRVDVIHHLAGQVAVTSSVKNPREDFETNAVGTFNVIEAVRLSERKPVLFYASTNKVYGEMADIGVEEKKNRYVYRDLDKGIDEKRSLDFHSPYGCSKGVGDQYVRDYSRIYGLKTAVFRQSCIYGPHQFGVEDQGWLAWFTIAAILGKKITIYGDGKQVRDILFVDDLFECWEKAIEQMEVISGGIYNVGGGVGNTLSLLELISMLEDILGKKIHYEFGDWRQGDQPVYISDNSRIQELLNWSPKVSLDKGLDIMMKWINENRHSLDQFF